MKTQKYSKSDKIQIKSLLSSILYVISFGTFLFNNIILSLGSAYNLALNFSAWIYLLSFGSIFIMIPIYYYLIIKKRFTSSEFKSFELLGGFLFYIVGVIISYIPDFTFSLLSLFGNICAIYPGNYVMGVFTASVFILMSAIFVPKSRYS